MSTTTRPENEAPLEGSPASAPTEPPPGPSFPSGDRRRRIAEAAYYRAERRGFGPGHELDDWLAAEKELRDSEGLMGRYDDSGDYLAGTPD